MKCFRRLYSSTRSPAVKSKRGNRADDDDDLTKDMDDPEPETNMTEVNLPRHGEIHPLNLF